MGNFRKLLTLFRFQLPDIGDEDAHFRGVDPPGGRNFHHQRPDGLIVQVLVLEIGHFDLQGYEAESISRSAEVQPLIR